MAGSAKIILKKVFSLSLIFNSLITLTSCAGILYGYYIALPYWQPYAPWLINGNLFWVALVAGLINIFPSAAIGRTLHTGRFLFHHYVYGFATLLLTSVCVLLFTSVPLLSLFLVDSTNVTVNTLRVFELGGLTLLLDDLPDVNKKIESWLNWTKKKMCKVRKTFHALQFAAGSIAFYCCISVILDTIDGTDRASQQVFLIGTLLVTSITSFALVKRKAWLKITPPEPEQN